MAFRDEYLQFRMDASKVIWILAGNDINPLPEPILDRLTVVEVPTPGATHLRAIAESVYMDLNLERKAFFAPTLRDDALDSLVDRGPRSIRKAITEAMTRAASEGRRALRADDIPPAEAPRRRAGFR